MDRVIQHTKNDAKGLLKVVEGTMDKLVRLSQYFSEPEDKARARQLKEALRSLVSSEAHLHQGI